MDVNAFCLTGSMRDGEGFSPSASICHDDGERHYSITMEWSNLAVRQGEGGNPAEALYAALFELLANFDDHLVTKVEVSPSHRDGSRHGV